MPFYEYRCEQGHSFDVMQRMADDPVTSCITCEASVQRIFHAPAVHFKGSGFYSTDYGKAGSAADKGSDDGSGEGSSSSGEGAGGDAKKSGSGTKDAKKESSTASTGAASD